MIRGAALALLVLTAFGCGSSNRAAEPRVRVLPKVSDHVLATCRKEAGKVGYRVPCPTRLPSEMAGSFIAPLPSSHEWTSWVGWSGTSARDHLAITASPTPTSPVKLVNGPAWLPGEYVELLGSVTVRGLHAQSVYVPPKGNDGSMFMHHIVLVWTRGGHTYGVGFSRSRQSLAHRGPERECRGAYQARETSRSRKSLARSLTAESGDFATC